MKSDFLSGSLQSLKFQRNAFLTLSFLSLGVALVETCFLFMKQERIIVTPPVIEKEFWVEGNAISPSYLEQFGTFLGQLLLGKSAQSAPMQRTILLRHAAADFYGVLKKKLVEEEEMLQKQNASYVFFPIDVKVNTKTKEVTLVGDRIFFVSGQPISQEKEEYRLSFSQIGSRLLLNGVSHE